MPDITDQILNRQPYVYADDYADPFDKEELSRIAARFMNTHYGLGYRPHWDNDQLDECILEIKQSMFNSMGATTNPFIRTKNCANRWQVFEGFL